MISIDLDLLLKGKIQNLRGSGHIDMFIAFGETLFSFSNCTEELCLRLAPLYIVRKFEFFLDPCNKHEQTLSYLPSVNYTANFAIQQASVKFQLKLIFFFFSIFKSKQKFSYLQSLICITITNIFGHSWNEGYLKGSAFKVCNIC